MIPVESRMMFPLVAEKRRAEFFLPPSGLGTGWIHALVAGLTMDVAWQVSPRELCGPPKDQIPSQAVGGLTGADRHVRAENPGVILHGWRAGAAGRPRNARHGSVC